MRVWIQNEIGYLQGYSIIPQETMIEAETDREPTDFTNWRYDGTRLIYDPDNAPQPESVPPTDIDLLKKQNAKLALQVTEAQKAQQKSNQIIAKLMLKIQELEKKIGGQ